MCVWSKIRWGWNEDCKSWNCTELKFSSDTFLYKQVQRSINEQKRQDVYPYIMHDPSFTSYGLQHVPLAELQGLCMHDHWNWSTQSDLIISERFGLVFRNLHPTVSLTVPTVSSSGSTSIETTWYLHYWPARGLIVSFDGTPNYVQRCLRLYACKGK